MNSRIATIMAALVMAAAGSLLAGCAGTSNSEATPCQFSATCYIAPLKS